MSIIRYHTYFQINFECHCMHRRTFSHSMKDGEWWEERKGIKHNHWLSMKSVLIQAQHCTCFVLERESNISPLTRFFELAAETVTCFLPRKQQDRADSRREMHFSVAGFSVRRKTLRWKWELVKIHGTRAFSPAWRGPAGEPAEGPRPGAYLPFKILNKKTGRLKWESQIIY